MTVQDRFFDLAIRVGQSAAAPRLRRLVLPALLDPEGWRFHGLGMVQKYVSLDGRDEKDARVHVWHPSLFHFGPQEATHNHRFDLTSCVLHKGIQHVECAVARDDEAGTHVMWGQGNEDQGGHDHPQELPGLWRIDEQLVEIPEGSAYTFPQGCFHRTEVRELAITVIFRGPRNGRSRTLFPVGVPAVHGTTLGQEIPYAILEEAVRALKEQG